MLPFHLEADERSSRPPFEACESDSGLLYAFPGQLQDDELGIGRSAVANAGDVNGDGYDDIIAGASRHAGFGCDCGMARVFSGRNGSVLYTWYGEPLGAFGASVDGAGDVDGDGLADLVVGAMWTRDSRVGYVAVFSGADGHEIWRVYGEERHDSFGVSVSGAGYVDSDEYADVIVGAPGCSIDDIAVSQGKAQVLSGADGSVVHEIWGDAGCGNCDGEGLGYSVSGVGDVDGDGLDDVLIGSIGACPLSGPGHCRAGAVRLYTGSTLRYLKQGEDWPVYHPQGDGHWTDGLGTRLAAVGDVDGDLVPDFIVGAPTGPPCEYYSTPSKRGQFYVISGALATLGAENDEEVLFAFTGPEDDARLGKSVSGAGNVNGDGYNDVIVSAPGYEGTGWVTVYAGPDGSELYSFSCFPDVFHCDPMSVAGGGDVNADGFADFIIATPIFDVYRGLVRVFSGSCGCIPPFINVEPVEQVTICEGTTVILEVEADGSDLSYQWHKDGVEIPGATASTYTIGPASIDDAGQYQVTIVNQCGSVSSRITTLSVSSDPCDCNDNGIPDGDEIAQCHGDLDCRDCNNNGILDSCDISDGAVRDCDVNGIPDSCQDQARLIAIGGSGDLYEIDPGTGATTHRATTFVGMRASIAFGPDGTLFALRMTEPGGCGNDGALYTIDPVTGKAEFVGPTGLTTLKYGALAFDPTTGTLYGIAERGEIYPCSGYVARLFRLDAETGHGTTVGALARGSNPDNPRYEAMSFTCSGALYVLRTIPSPSAILEVEPTTGQVLSTVPLSLDGEPVYFYSAAMAFDLSGTLYVTARRYDPDLVAELYTLDETTGVLSKIGDTMSVTFRGLAFAAHLDCNMNGISDYIEISEGTGFDCNDNGVPDDCDIAHGGSLDRNDNGVPDECEPCGDGEVVFVQPENGLLDARQPHALHDPTELEGIYTFVVAGPHGAEFQGGACWTVCESNQNPTMHPGFPPIAIDDFASDGNGSYTITLNRPIAPGEVTMIGYRSATGDTVTTGTFRYLPGDCDGDGQSSPEDVACVIDCLNEARPCELFTCDMDRDESCAPADILRMIDLLNGAGSLDAWLGVWLAPDATCDPAGGCCCYADGTFGTLTEGRCRMMGGFWLGGEECDEYCFVCPRDTCIGAMGACCEAEPICTPGCEDPWCCDYICTNFGASGRYCCEVVWDSLCIDLAEDYCDCE